MLFLNSGGAPTTELKLLYHHCYLPANKPTNFYVGVTGQSSEVTFLVQYLLANLTGSTVNITQENCQNQREDQDDKENKHVRLFGIYRQVVFKNLFWMVFEPPTYLPNLPTYPTCLTIGGVIFTLSVSLLHFSNSTSSLSFLPDLHLHVGSRCPASEQYRATWFLCALNSAPLQSCVPSLPPTGVQLQGLFHMDRVQVEEHQRTDIPSGKS